MKAGVAMLSVIAWATVDTRGRVTVKTLNLGENPETENDNVVETVVTIS